MLTRDMKVGLVFAAMVGLPHGYYVSLNAGLASGVSAYFIGAIGSIIFTYWRGK